MHLQNGNVKFIGWGSLIMQAINRTWPHAEHLLVNHGLGGAFLQTFVLGSCPLADYPEPTDLFIMENLSGRSSTECAEEVSF